MDYETEVEMEKGFNPGKWQNNKNILDLKKTV
jgi:hypothetical protein